MVSCTYFHIMITFPITGKLENSLLQLFNFSTKTVLCLPAFCVDAPKVFIEPENLLKPYLRKARGTIIILHGHGWRTKHDYKISNRRRSENNVIFLWAGSTGSDIRFWMSQVSRWNIRFRHIRAIFPTGVVRAHRPGETNVSIDW